MFTFAVITCNRKHYLKNCVDSIFRFMNMDKINLIVIDNASIEDGIDEYLSSLPSSVEVKKFNDRCPNELHRAMNYAIDFAKKQGDDYINFIQDDYQYIREDSQCLDYVHETFKSHRDVVQLQTNMIWKKKSQKIGRIKTIEQENYKWFLLRDKPPCDNGFTRVALYDEIGYYPTSVSIHGKEGGYSSGEAWFARKTKDKYRMLSAYPNMSMIINCAYIRGNKRHGDYFPPPNDLYLEPCSEEDVCMIQKKGNQGEFCYIEEMTKTWGWTPKTSDKHSQSQAVESVQRC